MYLQSLNVYYSFNVLLVITLFSLNFTIIIFLLRIGILKIPLLSGRSNDSLYTLQSSHPQNKSSPSALYLIKVLPSCWHLRFNHPHHRLLHQILIKNRLPCSSSSSSFNKVYEACQLGKSQKLSLSLCSNKSCSILQLLYVNVLGPAPLLSS